ncbi:MAG TPA: hypothetical protein VLH80_00220, partial [Nitrospiraceae bacterium]|nr:hypothetical protein [Nitrospiraceae bacterium]
VLVMCGHGGGGVRYGLVPGGIFLDERETGDAVERIWLYFEPGVRDLVSAAGTNPIRMRMQGRERLLDPAKLVNGDQLHR